MATSRYVNHKGIKNRRMPSETSRQVIQEPYTAKKCYFYRDGDTKFKAVMLCIHPRKYKRLETVISELSTKVKLPFGVRSIFTPRGKDMITSLDSFENGESYVCSQLRLQARGVDPDQVVPPPRWYHDKPSSGTKELALLLKEQEFKNKARYLGKRYEAQYQKLLYPYTRVQPKKITMLKNGEPQIRHVVLINRRTAQTFEQILTDMSDLFGMAINRLFTVEGRQVNSLASLINGPDVLVAAGKEPFKKMIPFVYEPVESRVRSRMEMSRLEMRSRMDTSRMEMRSRLDAHQLETRSRLDTNRSELMYGRVAPRPTKNKEKTAKTRGRWKVWCTTSDLSNAGTSAQVTITVYGQKGNSGPIPLGFPDSKAFQHGQVDEFELDLGTNIGEIFKIRLAHDNTGEHPDWFCDEIRMQDEDTEETLVFPCRRWLSRNKDDHEICREIPVNRKGQPQLPVIKYEVTVTTGDLWNGGTSSSVYLTIYGDRGDSGVRQLYVSNRDEAFNKGQTNHFTIEAVSLGHLKRIIVGHDGTAPGEGWFLEKVSIQEPDAKPHEVYHFYCGRWLDEGEDDGKIVRELKVQDDYLEDILEKRNWEFEKWKYEGKNQVMLMSLLTGKALRVKPDGTVDGLGDARHPGSVFIVSSKKPMVRVFTSLFNSNFHLAIDQGKVTGQGRGGPQCEFRIHVQSDRTVMLEGVKFPLQFVTLQESGKLGDPRSVLDKDPAKRFHVYVKGVLRHKGIIMLRTSNIQAIGVDHDKSIYATGRCNRAAHFRVHKVDEGGIRMFESMIYPGFYLRFKDGKFDCNGSRNEDAYFLVEKHKYKGYFTLQSDKKRGTYMGFTARGEVVPTIDSGTNNIYIFPEVIEYGILKSELADAKLTPISERASHNNSPDMKRKIKADIEDGDYRVLVTTAESLDQGQVILAVYGDKGTTGPIVLSGSGDSGPRFKAGSTDEFKVNLSKIGKLFKVRLAVAPQNYSRNPCWKVQKLILVDMNTQERLVFDFNCWLSREYGDKDLVKEVPVVKQSREEESLPVVRYFITVYTGKDPGSETDAQIYITMYGDYGDSGKRELRVSNREHPFQQGQSDTFEIEAVHLGNLNKIQIGHNETKAREGWFCDKVVIREGKTANMEFVFPCGRWFDSGMEDRKLERTLMIQDHRYTLQTTTHSNSGTPMSDTVFLYLYGRDGCSGPLIVGSGKDGLFKPGTTHETQLSLNKHVGKLYKLRIGLGEEQSGCEWHLEKLKLQEQSTGEEFDIDVSRWMSRKKEDCDVWRELPVSYFDEPPLPVMTYTIEVHTSDISGADTTAAIYINLIGQRGDSGRRRLYATLTEGRMFSQGKIDKFTLEAVSLGAIKSINIGHSEKKPGKGWHLSYVAVKELNLNDEQTETYFPCNRWFDTGQDDQKIERELFSGQKPRSKPKSSGEFHMWLATAEDSEPANGGKATLVIYGDEGQSGNIDLFAPNSTAKLFEPANIDEFEVSTGDIGDIYKIRITREDKTDWRAWHLEEIKLKDKTTGEVYICQFDRWLSRDMENGDLSREQAVSSAGETQLSIKKYEVLVATGDHWAAETDANVHVTLFGSRGDSGRRILHQSRTKNKKFQRGQEDIFVIEAMDLEELKTVVIGHDGHGAGSGWFLKHIIVTDTSGTKNNKHMFPCGRWLDEGEADGQIERTLRKIDVPKLTTSKTIPSECGGQWKVKVKTSDMPDAGTQAQVYITIHGTSDYSKPVLLDGGLSSKECFIPGKESTFDVTVGEIGELAKIRLEHVTENKDSAWHVDWVWMKHLESAFEYIFIFNQWLADNGEDRQAFRECAVESSGWMPSPLLRYIIIVQTGRKSNSGAHGAMCTINFIGSQGVTGQQKLSHPLGTSADCMKDGMLDVYTLEAVCVGEIRNLRVGFDGRGKALVQHTPLIWEAMQLFCHPPAQTQDWTHMGCHRTCNALSTTLEERQAIVERIKTKRWFLESVTVMESLQALSESVFTTNTWLDTEKHPEVLLSLSETVLASSLPRGVDSIVLGHHIPETEDLWDLWIQTGNEESAGTQSVIVLVLCGTTGSSPPVYLNQSKEFHVGSLFHTQIKSGRTGNIFKIRLAFAEKFGNSWYLERIKLKDSVTKQEFNFDYNNWLRCTEDNQYGTFELPAIRPDIAPLPECTYKVCVVTGDLPCAETSADVNLMMIGHWGDSGQRYLTRTIDSRAPFSQGQTDEFELKLLSLGQISKILLGHNEYGRGHGWFCQQVSITDTDQHGNKTETVFACNRWFDTGVDDRQTTREFSAVGTVSLKDVISSKKRVSSNGIWSCYIKIAGTDKVNINEIIHQAAPQLSLTVYGSKGVAGPLVLEDRKNANICPGQTYSFKGLRIGNVGDFMKLRVSCGTNDETSTTWAIEKVLLEDSITNEKLWFDFNKYIGEMSTEFSKELPVIRPAVVVPPLIKYIVTTETSSSAGAGTAAKIYVTIYGQKGDSGRRLLLTNGRATHFRQGEENIFELEAVDLGKLEKVVVTKGSGDPWLLKQMIIKAGLYMPEEYLFVWNKWIGKANERNQEVDTTMIAKSCRPRNIAAPISEFPDFPVTCGQWSVETYTGSTGTTADATDITVIFCGSKRESNPVSLNPRNDNPFQPGMKDLFELSLAEDVGELIKIRLGFEDTSKHKKWHLKKITFEDNDTKDTFWFAPKNSLSVNDVSDGYLEFPVIWPGVPILPIIKYTITIEAGDVPDAALKESIFVKLDGEKGSTGYRSLKDRTESEHQQGQTIKAEIEVVSLVRLDSITIGHINNNPGSGWYLFSLTVQPSNEEKDYVFLCNRWLDSGQDDGEISRTLYHNDNIKTLNTNIQPIARIAPMKKVHSPDLAIQENKAKSPDRKPQKVFTYEITTVTGQHPDSGTTAQLVIVLYGDKGHSEPFLIEEDSPAILRKGSIQKFQVSTDTDLGELFKVRVGFNAAGNEREWYSDPDSCPSWFTEMIQIKNMNTAQEHHIETNQWVRIEAEQDFWREFPIKRENTDQALTVQDYIIDVYTGNRTGAGTNANVYIQIFGQNGDSGWRHLHSYKESASKFETGSHNMFTVMAVDLGKLSKVKVKHDGHDPGTGWYLDKIKVRKSQEPTSVFLFDCNRWLDEGEDDRAIERELVLTDVFEEHPGYPLIIADDGDYDHSEDEQLKDGNWHVIVTTSNQPGSGTEANVFLTVFGDKGHTEPFHLASENNECFQTGMVDHFDICMHPDDTGEITKVRLEHDNSGTGSGWRVDKLVMENQTTGEKYTLDINQFLSYHEIDGDIVYECPVGSPHKPSLKVCKYMVKVVTESDKDAGTEANVYINIIGNQGDSGKRFLKCNIDGGKMFASGKTNTFLVKAVDLGDLDRIVIGHDGVEPSSAWKLQCVIIRAEDGNNQESCVFPCGKWLTGAHKEVTIPKGKLSDDDDDDDSDLDRR